MAPHITFEEFDKKLESLPIYFDQNQPIESKYFFNRTDSLIYKLTEFKALPGSEYSGCIELRCCFFNEMAQDSAQCVAEDILTQTNDAFLAAQEALDIGLDIENEEFVGIYLFKDIIIKDSNGDLIGKQIKAARIDDDYGGAKVTKKVYSYIANKYKVLVCDNTQTPDGHSLWAYGVSKWGKLKIYNVISQEFVGLYDYKEMDPDVKPWSVPYNYPMQDENRYKKPFCEITDLHYHHLVLVVIASEIIFDC